MNSFVNSGTTLPLLFSCGCGLSSLEAICKIV
jgi:hypothetical protein